MTTPPPQPQPPGPAPSPTDPTPPPVPAPYPVPDPVEPFNAPAGTTPPQFPIQATYSPGAVTLASTYGANAANVLDARFYGPQAVEIAVRAKGAVSGIMLGTCHG